ncbi:MAG: N-6 DNA methylase [Paludibacteraceae bacterium]|nr:N-6 DNA methylase [Paludibacteraceae bacterium]
MIDQKEIMKQEQRESIYSGITLTFFNASRGHGMHVYNFDSPIQRLGEFAAFLFLIKNCNVKKVGNVPDDKHVIALQMGPSLEAGEVEMWIKRGIANIALVCSTRSDNAEFDKMLNAYIAEMRKHEQIDIIKAFDLIREAKLADNEYLTLLEYAENYMFSNSQRGIAEFTNPKSLALLVAKVLDIKDGAVFDPFMGLGSFATTLPSCCEFVGWDVNTEIVKYSTIKLALATIRSHCESRDSVHTIDARKYDAIVSFPPMMVKSVDVDLTEFCLKLFETHTTENGKAVVVIPTSFCSSLKFKQIRKELTEKNYIDKIIGIPGRYLYTAGASITIISLVKNRPDDADIEVFNFGEHMTEVDKHRFEINLSNFDAFLDYNMDDLGIRWIKKGDIVADDYDWHPLIYSCPISAPISRGAHRVALMDYLEPYRPEIASGEIDSLLSVESLNSPFDDMKNAIRHQTAKTEHFFRITEPVLAVGYKTTCLLYPIEATKEKPVFVSNKEILYRCGEALLQKYVAYAFSQTLMEQKSFEYTIFVNQSVDLFLHHQTIGLFPVIEQKVVIEDAEKEYLQQKVRDTRISNYVEKIKEEYVQEVRSRKHNMRPYLRELKASTDLAKLMIKNATSLEQLRKEFIPLLDKLELNRKALSEIIDHLSQVDKYGEPEVLDIKDTLEERFNYYAKHSLANFRLSITEEEMQSPNVEDPVNSKTWGRYVLMASYDFKRMIDCVIDNARVHGFEGNDEGHNISIDVETDGNDELVIRITNDGLPFPQGFDINRYGLLGETAGKHAGTGDGGHQVVSIAKHYGGYVSIESTKTNEPNPRVSIIIHLPIFDKDAWDEIDDNRQKFLDEHPELFEEGK